MSSSAHVSLLDEIIGTAIEHTQSTTELLRKCFVLSYQLKDEQLKAWLNQELDGYASSENLPKYRIIHIGALGDFSNGYYLRNRVPIPSLMMKKEHRDWAELVSLLGPVSAYEDLALRPGDIVTFPWPANLIALYQRTFLGKDIALLNAWQEVPKSSIVQLLHGIRKRVLTMALELQSDLGNLDLSKISPSEIQRAHSTITQVISPMIIATGEAHINLHTSIVTSDRKHLEEVLRGYGLTQQDLKELSEAEMADGEQKFGDKVLNWVKNAASKVQDIGFDVAKDLLTTLLKQYMGLK
ncbi:MAG TPA: hypothetical protein VKZ53_16260 [Candidatus Angelobacter sp.]|nr:hypothetical protein [Candidatus Angelobacter sp.]